jgi:hypothetical protein
MTDETPTPSVKRGGAREGAGRKRGKTQDVRTKLANLSEGGDLYLDELHKIAVEDPDATPAQRIKALELLTSYLWGRPSTQTPETALKIDVTHRLTYTDEELDALIADSTSTSAEERDESER